MKTTERFRARRTRAALPLAALAFAGLAFVGPAQAYQLGSLLKGIGDQVQAHTPAQKPAQPPPAQPAAAPPGARPMGLQGQAGTPLHKLGTDAVAVVDSATGTTAVRQMDYVFAKQSFNLGPKGAVTLSYLSGCTSEVITGGTVTVAPGGSRVVGGKLQTRATPGCRTPKPIILANASEAGATINRITPFSTANWDERELKSGPPVFKWDKAVGPVTIRVKDMDQDGQVIWQAVGDPGLDGLSGRPGAADARRAIQGRGGGRRPGRGQRAVLDQPRAGRGGHHGQPRCPAFRPLGTSQARPARG